MPGRDFWKGRRVWVTGHTGFKGAWLSLWLQQLGAKVYGFSHEAVERSVRPTELSFVTHSPASTRGGRNAGRKPP